MLGEQRQRVGTLAAKALDGVEERVQRLDCAAMQEALTVGYPGRNGRTNGPDERVGQGGLADTGRPRDEDNATVTCPYRIERLVELSELGSAIDEKLCIPWRRRGTCLLPLEFCDEHVPATWLRLDVSGRVEIISEGHADFTNQDLHVIGVDVGIRPDCRHDCRLRQPGSAPFDETVEEG